MAHEDQRQARLAAALRANLRRRKAQTRASVDDATPPPCSDEDAHPAAAAGSDEDAGSPPAPE